MLPVKETIENNVGLKAILNLGELLINNNEGLSLHYVQRQEAEIDVK